MTAWMNQYMEEGIHYVMGGWVPSSRAYHFLYNMVDADCVRDEGGFTVHWFG